MTFNDFTVTELKSRIMDGWELWYIAHPDHLPGRWELRQRAETINVHWNTIERVRRHALTWFEAHTEEIKDGRNWIYRLKQRRLAV